eukprot:CAMPEP_0118939810 /NCGR_PEP_ID=MMETSP1169-20130426/29891_1 /TAXON_ID=36882 /ORGANISM="Pyramimonas obovata, Strain CCMP722" /LENGTH=55 /DNA_ID=CAMNT_0006884151 /DNA_START=59 /DNA_END=224 /DNA_ORIENTATION=+
MALAHCKDVLQVITVVTPNSVMGALVDTCLTPVTLQLAKWIGRHADAGLYSPNSP